MTNNTQHIDKPPGSRMFLILILLLALGLSGCAGVYIKLSTPDVPPAPCPIQELLLDVSDFPENDWEETGSRSERGAPVRMGIERIGTSFSNPADGTIEDVYRFESDRQASNAYKEEVEAWFTPSNHHTEYAKPQELENLVVNTDHYLVGCNDLISGGREQCQFVASYGPYIIRLLVGMRDLSYEDVIELIEEIDHRAIRCLEQ